MKPSSLPEWAAYAKKAIAAAVGLALNLVALGVVPDEYLPWVQGVIAFLTVIGVYSARNTSTVDDPTTSTAVEAAVEPEGVAADAPLEPEPAEPVGLVDDYQPRHAAPTIDLYPDLGAAEVIVPVMLNGQQVGTHKMPSGLAEVWNHTDKPEQFVHVDDYDHSDDQYPLED